MCFEKDVKSPADVEDEVLINLIRFKCIMLVAMTL